MPDESGPQRPSEGRAPNAQVVQLKLRLQALSERMEALEQVRDEVVAVKEAIERAEAERKVTKPAPAYWPLMGPDEYAERRPQFLTWLRDVLAADHPEDARRLTLCWEKHPAAVHALTKLWLTWQAAELNRSADARDAAAWHVQWRPQLIDLAADDLCDCWKAKAHRPREPLSDTLLASFEPIHDTPRST